MRAAKKTFPVEATLIAQGDRPTEVIPGLPVADTGWMSRMDLDRLLPEPPPPPSMTPAPAEPTPPRRSFLRAWLAEFAAVLQGEALKPVSYVYLALLGVLATTLCMGIVSVRTPEPVAPVSEPPAISRTYTPAPPRRMPPAPLRRPERTQTPTPSPSPTRQAPEPSVVPSVPSKSPEPTPTPTPSITPAPTETATLAPKPSDPSSAV